MLTDEQEAVASSNANNLVVNAYAGSGKTSTLVEYARRRPEERLLYLAFNKAIKEEAANKFPRNVRCITTHGLAFPSHGRLYQGKLGNPRASHLARALEIDVISAGKALAVVTNYLSSVSREINDSHAFAVAPKGKAVMTGQLVDYARQAWEAMKDASSLAVPMPHDGYLKEYQLSNPTIKGVAKILFDECQPPGTMVYKPDGSQVAIENLRPGDRVMSYAQKTEHLNAKWGSVIEGISSRQFAGRLIIAQTDTRRSRYTPNHHCIAKIGGAFSGRHVLYLMKKGQHFRVGVTSSYHGKKKNAITGVRGRLWEEGADSLWVLAVFDTRSKALLNENLVTFKFRIPQVRFGEGNNFWGLIPDMTEEGIACLASFGRNIRYPLLEASGPTGRKILLFERPTIIRACNLMDGMQVLDAAEQNRLGPKGHHPNAWKPISVEYESYSGPVYSLTVSGAHTYVADGIVTHNCQDANSVTLDIVQRQTCGKVFVGDSWQAIYSFRGAVNALSHINADERLHLTASFRFGEGIAALATALLTDWGNATKPVLGKGKFPTVFQVNRAAPHAVISRTNACLFQEAVRLLTVQVPFGFAGGVEGYRFDQILDAYYLFAKQRGKMRDQFLAAFDSFDEMKKYGEALDDKEVKALVNAVEAYLHDIPMLVDEIKARAIPNLTGQEVALATTHKAKGLEWMDVVLCDDFTELQEQPNDKGEMIPPDSEEINILYVAMTRAMRGLAVPPKVEEWLAMRGTLHLIRPDAPAEKQQAAAATSTPARPAAAPAVTDDLAARMRDLHGQLTGIYSLVRSTSPERAQEIAQYLRGHANRFEKLQ